MNETLALAGYTAQLQLAAGEILEYVHDHSRATGGASHSATLEMIEDLVTGPTRHLPDGLRRLDGAELEATFEQALEKLLADRVLIKTFIDQALSFAFYIKPGFSFGRQGDSDENDRVRMRLAQIRTITTIPKGSVMRVNGGERMTRRAVNIKVHQVFDWQIGRHRTGSGVDWRPPSISYPGSGGYWHDVYAIGDVASMVETKIRIAEMAHDHHLASRAALTGEAS